MKNKLVYISIFLILITAIVPDLLSVYMLENINKKVICSVKLTNLNDEVISSFTEKPVKNIKYLALDDVTFINPLNSKKIEVLALSGYKFGVLINLSPKTSEYFKDLNNSINKYNISMLYFEEKNKDFDEFTFEKATDMAKNSGISIGLIENSGQNGLEYNEMSAHLSLLKNISNRSLFINQSVLNGLTEKDLKYRLLRSIVDRGIRFISVEAYDRNSLLSCNNVYGELNNSLTEKGYSQFECSVVKTPGGKTFKTILTTLFAVFQIIVFLLLLNVNKKHVKLCTALFVIVIVPVIYLYYNFSMILSAFIITITVPSTTAIWMYNHSQNIKNISQIIKYQFIFFANYIFSGCFIWLAMSDFVFRIGFETYKLASLSFILPLLAVLYYISKKEGINLNKIKQAFRNKKTIAATLVTILAIYIYISRSGNYSIFPASAPELKLRTFLENVISARPRFKEFLIGYPCFFLFFRFNRIKSKVLNVYLLLGANIAGISILNTFCHSFTPVNISIIRTLSGFILGTITSVLTCFILNLLYKLTLQFRLRYSFPDSRYR